MGYADVAHSGLIVLAMLAACVMVAAFVGMDRNATLRDRELYRPHRVAVAQERLRGWSWVALYGVVVMVAALLALLIGA